MFYGGMAGAAVTLVIAITVYIKLNIAQVITDLTGWNWPGAGRKARKTTSKQTDTSTKPTTKEIHVRKNVEKEVAAGEYVEPTEKMASGQIDPTALLSQESFRQTDLLKQGDLDPTALLKKGEIEPTALLTHDGLHPAALLKQEGLEPTTLLTKEGLEAKGLLIKKGHEPAALQSKTPKREPVAAAVSAGRDYSPDSPTETTILSEWNETNVLTADPDETTLLNETTLLDDIDETTLLTEEEPRFQKQVDIMIVHSNTII
jgi:hypothetical protein